MTRDARENKRLRRLIYRRRIAALLESETGQRILLEGFDDDEAAHVQAEVRVVVKSLELGV
jgi:hypothetical protein